MTTWDGNAMVAAWNGFLEVLDPYRPELFRYCRRLTGDVFEAEDLIQDTLEQGFAGLARAGGKLENPRAYVLRIASNLWVSRVRRAIAQRRALDQIAPAPAGNDETETTEQGLRVRAAAARLLGELSPQEQAALVLKEVFDFRLTEIAEILCTTSGAIKAALHRGRDRLRDVDRSERPVRHDVSRPVLEKFVALFNSRDRDGLLALMLDTACVEMSPVETAIGKATIAREPGWLFFNLRGAARWEVSELEGEPIVLVLSDPDRPHIGSVMRLETEADRISLIRVYAFCPDAVREVAARLDRPAAPMGIYRFSPELLRQLAATTPPS